MAVFFTKKQKAEFRKRKRRIDARKKKDGEDPEEEKISSSNDHDKSHQRQQEENEANVVEEKASMTVMVPKNLSAHDAKKFRKDARRKARAEGKNADQLEFVVEGSRPVKEKDNNNNKNKPPIKKKRKREFPCLNDLVKEEQETKKKEEHEQHLQQSEAALTEEYKSRYLALDCEMVGIGTEGKKSVLARASLVDWEGETVFDTFVQVPTRVSDFRTHVSGVTAADIRASKGAMKESECRDKVAHLLRGKVLVGHALTNDLHALLITHPKKDIRDTAKYRPFQRLGGTKWRPRKLRDLVQENLEMTIQQEGQAHDSTIDAKATMLLFRSAREEWERELEEKASLKKRKTA